MQYKIVGNNNYSWINSNLLKHIKDVHKKTKVAQEKTAVQPNKKADIVKSTHVILFILIIFLVSTF